MEEFAKDVVDRSNLMRGAILNPNNVLRYNHGGTFQSPANTKGDQTGEFKKHSSVTEISIDDIVTGRTIKIFANAQDVSEQMHESITGEVIKAVSSVTEKTGNVVDGRDKPIHEALYESLEKLELPLDENGELSMPTMMVAPALYDKLKHPPSTGEEFEKRLEALKVKKKNEAIQREKDRISRFERRYD